jgi:hypothetical protein
LRLDLGAKPGDGPVVPIGHWFFEQGRDHTQGGCALYRGWARCGGCFQHLDTTTGEIAPPEPDRVFPHRERFGDPRTRPAGQRQQHRAGSICLAAITRTGKRCQGGTLFLARRNRGLPSHDCTCESVTAANRTTKCWSSYRNLLSY